MAKIDIVPETALTVEEVAERLRVQPATVYKMIREGKLPAAKVLGRYRVAESTVDKLLRGELSDGGEG